MSHEPPTPTANLPTEILNTLNESGPERLREVVRYAEALAEHKEREVRLEESDNDEIEELITRMTFYEELSVQRADSL